MSTIIFNKKIVPSNTTCIGHTDRGFTLGHGLFETILLKRSTYPALDYHWKRLVVSAPLLGINLPFSRQELESMLDELIIKNNVKDKLAGARVTITHGESERGILPSKTPYPNFLINTFEFVRNNNPYSALIVNTRKNEHSITAKIKSISYVDNILAKQEAMTQGYDEAILLNSASNIADGSISNIFMVKDNQIITPPISDGALPGVIRAILLEKFNQDFSIIEKSIRPRDLLLANEIFLTNALIGIKPINKINTQSFYKFSVTNKLSSLLQDYTIEFNTGSQIC